MNKIFLALILAFATTAGFAQTATPPTAKASAQATEKTLEQRAEEITAGMSRHLRLSPEQTQKVRAINLKSMQGAEAAKRKFQKEPRRIVQQIDIISQTRLSELKEVLTPIQFQQYQQRREEKMGVPKEAQSNPASRQGASYQENY